MAAKNEILKGMNLIVDGIGYAATLTEVVLPTLKIKTEEVRMGGMDAPMDMDVGMEKLEISYTVANFDPELQKKYGLAAGSKIRHTIKGATEDRSGNIHSDVIHCEGKIIELDQGTWKAGATVELKIKVSLTFYSRERDNELLHEIDVENMKRVIDGSDQLEKVRSVLGL